MIRDDDYFRLMNGFQPAGQTEWERTLVIWPQEEAVGNVHMTADSFDPTWYYTVNGLSIPERLEGLHEMGEAANVHVRREGSIVTVETSTTSVLNRYRFDLDQGGSLIESYTTTTEDDTWLIEYSYVNLEDAWVPASFKKTNQTKQSGLLEREVVFKNQVINQPVPADEFTIEAMGIQARARVTDRRLGLFYEYQNEGNTAITTQNAADLLAQDTREENTATPPRADQASRPSPDTPTAPPSHCENTRSTTAHQPMVVDRVYPGCRRIGGRVVHRLHQKE